MIADRGVERFKEGRGSKVLTGRWGSSGGNSIRGHSDMAADILCLRKAAIVHLIVRLLAINREGEDSHSLTIDGLPSKPSHLSRSRLAKDATEDRTRAEWRDLAIRTSGVLIFRFGR